MDHRASLDLASAIARDDPVELSMDHHRGPVGIEISGDPGRAQGYQGIGSPGICEQRVFFSRHHRDGLR
jgi:hypothetical protein